MNNGFMGIDKENLVSLTNEAIEHLKGHRHALEKIARMLKGTLSYDAKNCTWVIETDREVSGTIRNLIRPADVYVKVKEGK